MHMTKNRDQKPEKKERMKIKEIFTQISIQ